MDNTKVKKLSSKLEEYALNHTCTSKRLDKCIEEIVSAFGKPVQENVKKVLKEEFKTRAKKFNNIQLAHKILMNSLYGYFGTKTSRFYTTDVAESITLTGQEESKRVQEILEKYGYNILYGDTDSMFILVESMPEEIKSDIEEAKKWIRTQFVPKIDEIAQTELEQMAKEIGVKNPKLGENYHFKFKQEMIARTGIFLPGVDKKEAKKRYDLLVIDEEGVPQDKITSAGTPLKQSKLPRTVKEYFKKFIIKLLKEMVTDEEELLKIPRELREKLIEACENWNVEYIGSMTQFNKQFDENSPQSQACFAFKWNSEVAPKLKLPEYQLNTKYKFIEVVVKNKFTPSEELQSMLNSEQLQIVKSLYEFSKHKKVSMVGLIDTGNKLFMGILKSIFDIDVDRIVTKYCTNIFKPYFAVLGIPIEKIAFDIGDVDDLL